MIGNGDDELHGDDDQMGQSTNFPGFIPRGGGWELNSAFCAVNCVSSANVFWPFLAQTPFFFKAPKRGSSSD